MSEMSGFSKDTSRLSATWMSEAAYCGPALSRLELLVLQLARKDSRSLAVRPDRWARLLTRLLDLREPQKLANTKLETLRRYALKVALGRGDDAAFDARSMLSAGYRLEQLTIIHMAFADEPVATGSWPRRMPGWN